MDESRGGSRIVYPKLFPTLTEADLVSQFRLAPEERAWAGTAARRGPSMVVLVTQLKVFQSIGHFLPLAQIPATALSYIAKQLSLAAPTDVSIDPRTTYRLICSIEHISRFIGCGIYEATYILDILQNTLSEIHPTRLYADSHGQSAHVFALAYLLGIDIVVKAR